MAVVLCFGSASNIFVTEHLRQHRTKLVLNMRRQIFHQKLYVISAKVWPKRNTSWRMGRGEKKTHTKVGIPLSPSSSRFSSLDSLFPQPPPPHLLPTFTFLGRTLKHLSLTIKKQKSAKRGKVKDGECRGEN